MNDNPIIRLNAALEGRYRIDSELGEGGMATVYLADDLKHERKVALKVLKPELAAVVGAERFLAEIKTTANLQHPHILPLHDSGEADGFLYYVMPYVEGETLRDRIDRERQLPVDEAIGIGTAVAGALQAAHEQGVVHRDIKPANILLSKGEPLVSDFGIALAVSAGGGGRLTETGLSLGTPHYMSPEQATGDASVGPATDVYALGCVLYEMLVGEPPYTGSTPQAILGKIIQAEPVSATKARRFVPAHVDAAIRKALEKIPGDRFTGAQALAQSLSDPGFRHGTPGRDAGEAARHWKRLALASSAAAAALASVMAWTAFALETAPTLAVARFERPFRVGQQPTGQVRYTPDGSAVVYVGAGAPGSATRLWIRRWADPQSLPIPGTEGVRSFDVSPDGREVAVSVGGRPTVVPMDGGPRRSLADGGGAISAWGEDGYVYFGALPTGVGGLVRTLQTGGPVEVLTQPKQGEILHGNLRPLRGGSHAVFQVWKDRNATDAEIWLLDLETLERHLLTPGSNPEIGPEGRLFFGTTEGALFTAALDVGAGRLAGSPVRVLGDVAIRGEFDVMDYAISSDGSLLYRRGPSDVARRVQLVWVSRSGEASPVEPGWEFDPGLDGGYAWSLSPDGSRIATTRVVDGNWDIWIKQLPTGPFDRLTVAESEERYPVWTPDGEFITYSSGEYGDMNVWQERADGSGEPFLVIDPEPTLTQKAWSPDGEWLVVVNHDPTTPPGAPDIWGVRRSAPDTLVSLVSSSDFLERMPRVSPDARWLAYSSDESGQSEVYVRPFPDTDAARFRVSTDGGHTALWSHDGSELFYFTRDRKLVSAQVSSEGGFSVRSRTELFALDPDLLAVHGYGFVDVASDGRFLMGRLTTAGAETASVMVLVQGFGKELRDSAAGG